jgi:hypothetical protein
MERKPVGEDEAVRSHSGEPLSTPSQLVAGAAKGPELSDPYYLAVDPGETSGVAVFDSQGLILDMCEVESLKNLVLYLEAIPQTIRHIIYEGYTIFPGKALAHTGSEVETVQAIGAIRSAGYRRGTEFTKQFSNILPIAQQWTGKKVPSSGSHGHDEWSAYNHGMYYLIKNQIVPHRILRANNG